MFGINGNNKDYPTDAKQKLVTLFPFRCKRRETKVTDKHNKPLSENDSKTAIAL